MKLLVLALITGLVTSLFLVVGEIIQDFEKEANEYRS